MSYLVFARKWRPQNFDQIIGQEHIATTLKNAISLDRVAHAYLFSGPRGIGKTSTARILAKALNCSKGPTAKPCNRCQFCAEIVEGRSLDVIEIDGASNRGIEQIRQLRENVKFAPAKSRFKIYIIDEVHQITTDGFNALLKTLEEPPAHIKFIFATTQVHKVLPTIISRCQRFDFKPLSASLIVHKLKQITKKEGLDITEQALVYIGRAAAGSMRDAESILDQLSSFCKGQIDLPTVNSMLGIIEFEAIEQLVQKIIERNSVQALTFLQTIINQGKDLSQLIAGLIEHFRNIMLTKLTTAANVKELIELPEDFLQRITEQAKALSLPELFYIFDILVRCQENLRKTLSARVLIEVAILKLAQRENFSSLDEILTRLNNLAQNLPVGQTTPKAICSAAPALPGSTEVDQSQAANSDLASHNYSQNSPLSASGNQEENERSSSSEPGPLNPSWVNLIEAIKVEKMFVASFLEHGQLVSLKDKYVTVAFSKKNNFYKETLEHKENKTLIESKLQQIFGRPLQVKFIIDNNLVPINAEQEPGAKDSDQNLSNEAIVQAALKIFQGRIVK